MVAADAGFFEVDVWGAPVGAGVAGARYCTLSGVAKLNGPAGSYVVANEFICGRIGLALGLPVPPGVIVDASNGEPAYVVLRFGKKSERPPPVIPADLVEDFPRVAAGIVVFDSLILNGDRHQENVAYSRAGLPVNVFDHSHALLGSSAGNGTARLTKQLDSPFIRGCLVPHLRDGSLLYGWVERVQALRDDYISDVIGQATQGGALPDATDRATVLATLLHRRDRIRKVIDEAIAGKTFPLI
jgi:hypothetical protein